MPSLMVVISQYEVATGALLIGAVAGAVVANLQNRSRISELKSQAVDAAHDVQRTRAEYEREVEERRGLAMRFEVASRQLAELEGRREAEKESLERERATIKGLRSELTGNFAQLSAEALHKNSDAFLKLAQASLGGVTEAAKGDLARRQQAINESLSPVTKHLETLQQHIRELEKQRGQAYGEITTQVRGLQEAQGKLLASNGALREETARLVTSLRSSSVRGRWGELQLRNVIELSGMVEYCDFFEQRSFNDADGAQQRPDMTVRLPSEHYIAVDAKAPLVAYLDALNATSDDERDRLLRAHAVAIRSHCTLLSRKAYWQNFDQAPEFVVLFLPGEMFYSAALQADGKLLDWSWEQNVILATPTMLIALLKTIAHGWRAAEMEKNAIEVQKVGVELYRSLKTMGDHIGRLAKNIGGSVDAYNDFVGSFEKNVFAKARRFSELKVVSEDLPELPDVEKHLRQVTKIPIILGDVPVLGHGNDVVNELERSD